MWNLIFWSWLPTICMLVFGLLTVRHVRQGRNRVAAQTTQDQSQRNQKKTDSQLIQMLVVQCFVFGSTTTVYSFILLYLSLENPTTDVVQKAINNLLLNVFSYIALTGPCLSFYLFTLSSKLFRHELMRLLRYRRENQMANNNNTIAMSQMHN